MFANMFMFEWRYWRKQPSFYVTMLIFFSLPVLLASVESSPVLGGGNVLANSPFALARPMLMLGVFAMFLVVNFVAVTATRNDTSGMAEILYAKPFEPLGYQLGRLMGTYTVVLLVFSMVPLGFLVGTIAPWVDAQRMGPFNLSHYFMPFVLFAVPGLFALSCIFYTAALKFRSIMPVYLVAVVMFILYQVSRSVLSEPEHRTISALLDPFGLSTFTEITRYWTIIEKNTQVLQWTETLVYNRLIWIAIGLVVLFLFAGLTKRLVLPTRKVKKAKKGKEVAEVAPLGNNIHHRSSGVNHWSQFVTRTRFEIRQVMFSAPFYVLLALSIFMMVSQFINPNGRYGTADWPYTYNMVQLVASAFSLMLVIVLAYYSAETVWRERGAGIGDIIDSTPASNLTFWASKLVAVCSVIVSLLLVGMVIAIMHQLYKGYSHIEIGQYLLSLLFFTALPLCLNVTMAFLIQVLSPGKFIGMLIFVGYLIIASVLQSMGLEHNMYSFGGSPTLQYSDLNGYGWYLQTQSWYMLYWGALAVTFSIVGFGLWQRGPTQSLKLRMPLFKANIGAAGQGLLAASLFVFVSTGGFIYYNTKVLNEFVTTSDMNDLRAEYEKKYIQFADDELPQVTKVKTMVDISPAERKIVASAELEMENRSKTSIGRFLINLPSHTPEWEVIIDGGKIVEVDEALNVAWFEFNPPLEPGQTVKGQFKVTRSHQGFKDRNEDTLLVENGTFIDNFALFPSFGFSDSAKLYDKRERAKRGLGPVERAHKLEDERYYGQSMFGKGIGYIDFEATIATAPDQTAIAPGYLQKTWEENGKRYFHYKMDAPIINFYAFLSARLEVKKVVQDGVNIEVYYHPTHGANVDVMIESVKNSIAYFSEHFSPYQYRQMRIIEFPGYRTFAQAFANTVPFSEGISFSADLRDKSKIDPVYYITAHELAHQWWGHQLRGANVQGVAILSETLSQYSALMVMENKYGPEKMRAFLKYELDNYLRGRTQESVEEMPLMRAENQSYIHYRKGSVIMAALRDRLGKDRVNKVLKGFIAKYAGPQERLPTTLDLVNDLKAVSNASEQAFIASLFETITLYDLKADKMEVVETDDGKFEVTLTVKAKRFNADGEGKETQTKMDEPVDIALFADDPEDLSVDQNLIYSQKHQIVDGENVFKVIVDRKPRFGGVDPFVKLIDRDSADNIIRL